MKGPHTPSSPVVLRCTGCGALALAGLGVDLVDLDLGVGDREVGVEAVGDAGDAAVQHRQRLLGDEQLAGGLPVMNSYMAAKASLWNAISR